MAALDKLTKRDIAWWRLHTQRLLRARHPNPFAVVEAMLAVQAENFSQSGWALAARCEPHSVTERDFVKLINDGAILRTHVIRPTWHYVLPDDIVWLTELTGPRVVKSFERSQQAPTGITNRQRDQMCETLLDALEHDGPLTRSQVQQRLTDGGHPDSGAAVTLAMAVLETSALVCSGPLDNGEQTYALVSERAPDARRLSRSEALSELARRYVNGHAPITEQDLAYWATLTLTDVRTALGSIADEFETFNHDGLTYWIPQGHEPPPAPPPVSPPTAHILQILDEIYRGYHVASRWCLDSDEIIERTREKAIGMTLIDGQLITTMTRRLTDTTVAFTLDPYRPLTGPERAAIEQVADDYGHYCDRAAVVTVAE